MYSAMQVIASPTLDGALPMVIYDASSSVNELEYTAMAIADTEVSGSVGCSISFKSRTALAGG